MRNDIKFFFTFLACIKYAFFAKNIAMFISVSQVIKVCALKLQLIYLCTEISLSWSLPRGRPLYLAENWSTKKSPKRLLYSIKELSGHDEFCILANYNPRREWETNNLIGVSEWTLMFS